MEALVVHFLSIFLRTYLYEVEEVPGGDCHDALSAARAAPVDGVERRVDVDHRVDDGLAVPEGALAKARHLQGTKTDMSLLRNWCNSYFLCENPIPLLPGKCRRWQN